MLLLLLLSFCCTSHQWFETSVCAQALLWLLLGISCGWLQSLHVYLRAILHNDQDCNVTL